MARFRSARRLQRAKQRLVETTLNGGDISIRVRYNSVGTFSARFADHDGDGIFPTNVNRGAGSWQIADKDMTRRITHGRRPCR